MQIFKLLTYFPTFLLLKAYYFYKYLFYTFAPQNQNDSVAQLVEQLTLNQWVESSSLSGVTPLVLNPLCNSAIRGIF